MNISVTNEPAAEVKADAVVVGHFQDSALSTAAAGINEAAGGALARLIETEDITGKRGELTTLLAPAGTATTTVVVVGLGKQEDLNRGAGLRAAAVAAKSLAKKERAQVAFYLSDGWSSDLVEAAICGAVTGCEGQDLYRAEKELHPFGELLWSATDASTVAAARATASGVSLRVVWLTSLLA